MARILIAEDDESLLTFLKKSLKKEGHKVAIASDGEKALTELQKGEFDILVTDLVMPIMGGIDLAKKAVEMQEKIKIMFITGFSAVALEAEELKMEQKKACISKPFHLKSLNDEIKKILAS